MNEGTEETAKELIFQRSLRFDPSQLRDIHNQFFPGGRTILNRTPWLGNPPRSCGITNVRGSGSTVGEDTVLEITVEYRPKDWVTFTGGTKYVGWTAYMPNRAKDGTFLGEHGEPLDEDTDPILLPFEVYRDRDFNDFDFGKLVREVPKDYRSITYEELTETDQPLRGFRLGSSFVVQHRYRQKARLVVADSPSGNSRGAFGEHLSVLNVNSPHLKQVVSERLLALLHGYFEGRFLLDSIVTDSFFMVDLTNILVDASGSEPRFNCLEEFLPEGFIGELAKRLSARYEIHAREVTGERVGLLVQTDDGLVPPSAWGAAP